jgi:hypothetical protein
MLWWLKNIANDTNSNGLPGNNSISGQNDWWIASFDEIQEIHQKLGDLRRIYFAGEKSYFPSYIDSSPGASVPTHPYYEY